MLLLSGINTYVTAIREAYYCCDCFADTEREKNVKLCSELNIASGQNDKMRKELNARDEKILLLQVSCMLRNYLSLLDFVCAFCCHALLSVFLIL